MPYVEALISEVQARSHSPTIGGGRAKQAENYPLDLVVEIIRGMRDTADFEEERGDETEGGIAQ